MALYKQLVIKKTNTLLGKVFNKIVMWLYGYHEPKLAPIEPVTPQLVAKRFRQLFTDHGLEETQIPRVFPKISLDDLSSDEKLIKKLSPDLINEAAKYFNVNSRWIEGVDSAVYDFLTCYKQPEVFFQILNKIKIGSEDHPFRIITHVNHFDWNDDSRQSFSILFVENLGKLGDQDIERYYLDTGWSWSHEPCRIQIKALALQYWRKMHRAITIYQVAPEIYQQIEDFQLIPHNYLVGGLASDPSLEDYIQEKSQSVVAKECDELPSVRAYIEKYHLKEFQLDIPDTFDCRKDDHQTDLEETLQQKASRVRHERTNQLKRECVQYWLANQRISNNQTARRFYQSLPVDRKKLLSESNAEKTLSTAISEFKRRDKLEKLPTWLIGFDPENT